MNVNGEEMRNCCLLWACVAFFNCVAKKRDDFVKNGGCKDLLLEL